MPEKDSCDDEESLRRMKEWMKTEAKKKRQDLNSIQVRMDQTHADRRRSIVTELATVRQVQEEYTCLFSENEVSRGFKCPSL